MIKPFSLTTFILLTCFSLSGCDENERVAQVAIEAAERQAKQNELMAENNRELAKGTKQLIEADAQARNDLINMQHDLQYEQAQVGNLRDELEDERRNIASQRLTESRLGPILKSCAAAALGITTIGFCWYLLYGLKSEDADQLLSELLVEDLSSDEPTLLPRLTTPQLSDQEANKQITKE